jgi:hypothetical protein
VNRNKKRKSRVRSQRELNKSDTKKRKNRVRSTGELSGLALERSMMLAFFASTDE